MLYTHSVSEEGVVEAENECRHEKAYSNPRVRGMGVGQNEVGGIAVVGGDEVKDTVAMNPISV